MIKKYLALVLSIILTVNTVAVFANEYTGYEDNCYEETASTISEATDDTNVNKDIYSTSDSVLISDGYELYVDVPKEADNPIILSDGLEEEISFSLPDEAEGMEAELTNNDIAVYTNDKSDVSFGVQSLQMVGDNETTMEGVRTIITIENSKAAKDYSFTYDLNSGEKLISSAEYLGTEYDTNEIFIVNERNEIIYIIDAPWAKDANGNDIKTEYSIDGNTLIQHVEFNENTAFPVVADPSAWQIAKCAGSISWVIGSTVLAASKIVKIKKYIKALGGVKKSAALLMGATSLSEKSTTVAKTLLSLASTLSGVDSVYKNCNLKSAITKIKKRLKKK